MRVENCVLSLERENSVARQVPNIPIVPLKMLLICINIVDARWALGL